MYEELKKKLTMHGKTHECKCPKCGGENCVTNYVNWVGGDTIQYGVECTKCFAMWNVQYGNIADYKKYLFN